MSEQEESRFIQHLDSCPQCVGTLQEIAAPDHYWDEARSMLSDGFISASPEVSETCRYAFESNDTLPIPVQLVLRSLAPTDNPESLGRMDQYEVRGVVGVGAMGVVLKADDPHLDRVVALKVMAPSLADCGAARQRFAREAKAAAAVLHPNVIAIHSVCVSHALPYLSMPYIAGESLQQRIDREGPLPLSDVLRIGSQVAAGLNSAHRQGLIHRDIKPSNIMLDAGVETAVITDFGLARTIDDATMTRSGAITGTPDFMSPEQAQGQAIGFESDLFSLGSLLYTLCTGHPPFRAETSFGVLRRITDEDARPIRECRSEIPGWMCTLIEKLHSKTPGARPNAGQAVELLEKCLAHTYQPNVIALHQELSEDKQNYIQKSHPLLFHP
ncbi:MAG: serine/threonine-protein kinase, partial [Planctomycetota bacterium]